MLELQMVSAQLQFNDGQAADTLPSNMPAIESLEATCDGDNMNVKVTLDRPYDGIIYSKGYFSDPACR